MAEATYTDLSKQASKRLANKLVPLVTAMAATMKNEIVQRMDPGPPRTGRSYRIPGTETEYTASAPGQPPAIREGSYRSSWDYTRAVVEGHRIVAAAFSDRRVGRNSEYLLGELLEHGTNDLVNFRVKMQPRPHIEPAKRSVVPRLKRMMQAALT